MDTLATWYKGLQARERTLVLGAAAAIGIALLYLVFFGPFATALAKREARVESKQQDLVWMRSAANNVRIAAASRSGAMGSESLVVLVNRTAQQAGIAGALNNQSPQGDNGIRVRLEGVNFDSLVVWLGMLEQQYGVRVDNANVDRTDKAGVVNATLSLLRGPRT